MARLLLGALVFAGCATAPAVVPLDMDPAQWETVESMRLPVKKATLERDGVGQIRVELVDSLPGTVLGRAHRDIAKPCRPWVELELGAPATVLAHELGHALLLMHSPDAPSGIMAPETRGENMEITEEQRALMQVGAAALKLCRKLDRRKKDENHD